jgi:hypothetical protein
MPDRKRALITGITGQDDQHSPNRSHLRRPAYDTPWPASERTGWKIYSQKQPGTVSYAATLSWNIGTGGEQTAAGQIDQDQAIMLLPGGLTFAPARPAVAELPSLSF